jgi:hypothetical protein
MERDDKQYVFNTILLYTIYDDAQTVPHISYQPTNPDHYTIPISILVIVITYSGFLLNTKITNIPFVIFAPDKFPFTTRNDIQNPVEIATV